MLEARQDVGSQLLTKALKAAGPGQDQGIRSRTGSVLPGWNPGPVRALVSTFDAAKEAARWAEDLQGGTVAVFGAAGREAAAALRGRGVRLAFWVEPQMDIWQSLLTWQDGTGWLDRDDWVPVFGGLAVWNSILLDRYHPLWDGAFQTREWRAATQGREPLWEEYRQATLRTLETTASDASTQARFGERWYRNTLMNLKHLHTGEAAGCQDARVVVAGAGPSLEEELEKSENRTWLENRHRTGDRLFSTDTALPALSCRGIVPDLVLCLDGQLPTYHHFVPRRPTGVPLVADLSSLPLLERLGMPVVRYLSGHPFGTVIHRFFPELPLLDGSLGNVSGLALRTAQALGARRVDTWGVDFAYRDGKAYARGTYVYPLAQKSCNRLLPLETRLGASCYGAKGLERAYNSQGSAIDTTPLMREYHGRWERAGKQTQAVTLKHGSADLRWEAFSEDWARRLRTLPLPSRKGATHSFVRSLPPDRREDWLALWPLALAMHRQGIAEEDLPEVLVSRALAFLQD